MAAAVDASDVQKKGGVYVPKTAPTAKAAPKAAPRGGGAQGGAQVTGADSSARHDAADERYGAQDDARRDAADERVQVDAVSLLAVREELKALAALWAYERRPLELKFRQTAAFAQRASLRVRWQGLPKPAPSMQVLTTAPSPPHRYAGRGCRPRRSMRPLGVPRSTCT